MRLSICVMEMLCVRIIEYAFGLMRLDILCVSVYAFELFEGLVKDYGVCVWTYAFALDLCVWTYAFIEGAFALLSVIFFVMFDPIGDFLIKPLFPIVPYNSVNFCLTFLVKYDKCRSSLDFLDFAFFICDLEPFRYVLSVNDGQWKGFRIYGIIIFWYNLFVECYTITAPTNGKHQQFICFER